MCGTATLGCGHPLRSYESICFRHVLAKDSMCAISIHLYASNYESDTASWIMKNVLSFLTFQFKAVFTEHDTL